MDIKVDIRYQVIVEESIIGDGARDMAVQTPFGQPILVGHHSENRDRNFRDRIHNTFGKAFAEQNKQKTIVKRP